MRQRFETAIETTRSHVPDDFEYQRRLIRAGGRPCAHSGCTRTARNPSGTHPRALLALCDEHLQDRDTDNEVRRQKRVRDNMR